MLEAIQFVAPWLGRHLPLKGDERGIQTRQDIAMSRNVFPDHVLIGIWHPQSHRDLDGDYDSEEV